LLLTLRCSSPGRVFERALGFGAARAGLLQDSPLALDHFSGWLVTTKLEKLAVGARHPSRRQWNGWANFVVVIRLSVQAFAGLTTRESKRDRASTT
jgi:hypothetical protein